jgi:hypothetical protein
MYDRNKVFAIVCILVCVIVAWSADAAQRLLQPLTCRFEQFFDECALQTGDLLLWSYMFHLRTDVEKLVCGSQYTHVSIVFVDKGGTPYAWETVGSSGNRLVRLEAELADPRYRCAVRRISRPLCPRRFEVFARMALGQAYSFGFWRGVLFKWAPYLTVPVPAKKHAQAPRFCSELAAFTYESMGVMDFALSGRTHAVMLPGDFSESGETCRPLPLVDGHVFGPEVRLKYRLIPNRSPVPPPPALLPARSLASSPPQY